MKHTEKRSGTVLKHTSIGRAEEPNKVLWIFFRVPPLGAAMLKYTTHDHITRMPRACAYGQPSRPTPRGTASPAARHPCPPTCICLHRRPSVARARSPALCRADHATPARYLTTGHQQSHTCTYLHVPPCVADPYCLRMRVQRVGSPAPPTTDAQPPNLPQGQSPAASHFPHSGAARARSKACLPTRALTARSAWRSALAASKGA